MSLRTKITFAIGLLLLSTSACSVYKSSGRKSFENKAPNNVKTASLDELSTKTADQYETCWSQPASDPLWHVDAQSSLVVTKMNDDEIQVCLQAP